MYLLCPQIRLWDVLGTIKDSLQAHAAEEDEKDKCSPVADPLLLL